MFSSKDSVVIVSAKRSAIGSFCGSLSTLPAHEIGSEVIKDIIKKTAKYDDVYDIRAFFTVFS